MATNQDIVNTLRELIDLQKGYSNAVKETSKELTAQERIAKRRNEKAEEYNTRLGKTIATLTAVDGKMGKFKRFSYGFLPKGFFRAMNATASSLESIDIAVGRVRKGIEKTSKIKSLFGRTMTMGFKDFDKMGSQIRAAQTAQETYYGRSTSAAFNRRGRQYYMTPDAAERQMIGRQKAEKTLRRKRALEVGGMITGIRKREEPLSLQNMKKAAVKFYEGIKNTDWGKIINLTKKYVIRAAILFTGVVFRAVGIVVLLYMLFKGFWPQIKESVMAAWEAIKQVGMIALAGLNMVWEGLKGVWNAFFGDGDLVSLIDSLLTIAGGLLIFAGGLVITALTAGLVLLGGLLMETGARLLTFLGNFFSKTGSLVNKIATTIAAILGVVMFIVSGAWAAVIAAAIGYYVAKKFAGFLGFHADGGTVTSPLQIVGERGPEIAALPRGTKVMTNTQSKNMVGGNTFNITINARDTSDAELRRVADKIGQMINGKINRTTSSRTLGA